MSDVAAFQDVSVTRGRSMVLRDVNLTLPAGQIIGLLGPSGAGKSTIMRALVGVQSKVSGAVTVLGLPAGSPALATRVAYSTQASSVFDDLNVRQNLEFARTMLGAPATRIDAVLGEVGLTEFATQKVGSLSGGQRNRVSLAIAMLGSPELLILDEPTVGLDPVLRAEIWAIFRQLADAGKTLLVSSHVMDEAERCDRLIFVRDGRVIANDTLANILLATGSTSAENAFLALAKKQVA
ncbi:MAG: ABC transporter ATP-binding protein [Micrococcales bacterium]